MNVDINYLAENLSTLCGMPVRIYTNKELTYYFSKIDLEKDPILLDIDEILKRNETLGYYENEFFYYYGYINYENNMLILGPSREIIADSKTLSDIAIKLGISNKHIDDFKNKMTMIIPMPLSSLLQALASLNYILNDEKVDISKLLINNDIEFVPSIEEISSIHNSYELEKQILQFVYDGDLNSFSEFVKGAQSTRENYFSNDYIRNLKDIFIVTTTLVSRKAIEAGLDMNISLDLSDLYMKKMEMLKSSSEIVTLQYNMILEYINRVNKIKNPSELIMKVNKYILSNLSVPIKIDDLAKHLLVSKSTLCKQFKEKSGKTVNSYIAEYKINYSKQLIKSGVSISTISYNLGFSNQQYFTKMFKKIVGVTPHKYKEK